MFGIVGKCWKGTCKDPWKHFTSYISVCPLAAYFQIHARIWFASQLHKFAPKSVYLWTWTHGPLFAFLWIINRGFFLWLEWMERYRGHWWEEGIYRFWLMMSYEFNTWIWMKEAKATEKWKLFYWLNDRVLNCWCTYH